MKLDFESQYNHLQTKGVTFKWHDKDSVKNYLINKNSYFRLKSYCKNYDKKSDDTYINLDFCYLKDMADIDRQFRNICLKMVIHLEHLIKQKLIKDITLNPFEDGYSIVSEFLSSNTNVISSIKKKQSQSVCNELISKYEHSFSIWTISELLSFGELISLYTFYYNKYPSTDNYSRIMHHIKFLRNAVAHNNCLLNSLKKPYSIPGFRFSSEISTFISSNGMTTTRRRKIIENPVLHDFITMLYVFYKINPETVKSQEYIQQVKKIFNDQIHQNSTFIDSNPIIRARFQALIEIFDYFV